MFDSKKDNLEGYSTKKTSGISNSFIAKAKKESAKTKSGNHAKKYSETADPFVTEFSKIGEYKAKRRFSEIMVTMSYLWALNPLLTVMITLYIRTITRIVSLFDGTRTHAPQRGAGLKHESIMRMMWLHINHSDTFWKNVKLFIAVGCWRDIITMLSYDLQYHGWDGRILDWNRIGKLILAGLENPNTVNLVKKYLPQIRTNSSCNTTGSQADNIIGKWICSLLYSSKSGDYSSYSKYRKLKVSGTAHEWQQLISRGKMLEIDFDSVHGRALSQLVSSKFLKNQGLEDKYNKWISSKPIAKFTGFIHEIFEHADRANKKYQQETINKQFLGEVKKGSKSAIAGTSLIVVRDISRSMHSVAYGTKVSSNLVAKALALYFSYFLSKGTFANSFLEFASTVRLARWKGSTPYEKWHNNTSVAYGSTNFQGVIDLFVEMRHRGVPEDQFPSGILCISDGEFNIAHFNKTNMELAFEKLRKEGFSKKYVDNFQMVFWNIINQFYDKPSTLFETYEVDVPNVFYFSGYDPSVIAFLTGIEHKKTTPKNAKELFEAAMDQEILSLIKV